MRAAALRRKWKTSSNPIYFTSVMMTYYIVVKEKNIEYDDVLIGFDGERDARSRLGRSGQGVAEVGVKAKECRLP